LTEVKCPENEVVRSQRSMVVDSRQQLWPWQSWGKGSQTGSCLWAVPDGLQFNDTI